MRGYVLGVSMGQFLRHGGRTAMSTPAREAAPEDSKGPAALRGVGLPRLGVAIAAAVGIVALVVAEFSPLLEVTTSQGAAIDHGTVKTGANHSYALLPIAVVAALFAYGALHGSRPALVALGLLGLLVTGIALIGDLPDAHSTGVIGRAFEEAKAHPRSGLYIETLGGAMMVISAGLGLLASSGTAPGRPRRRESDAAAE
jgi:hypothetical protein